MHRTDTKWDVWLREKEETLAVLLPALICLGQPVVEMTLALVPTSIWSGSPKSPIDRHLALCQVRDLLGLPRCLLWEVVIMCLLQLEPMKSATQKQDEACWAKWCMLVISALSLRPALAT